MTAAGGIGVEPPQRRSDRCMLKQSADGTMKEAVEQLAPHGLGHFTCDDCSHSAVPWTSPGQQVLAFDFVSQATGTSLAFFTP